MVPRAPLTLRDAVFSRRHIAQIAALDTELARFFARIISTTLDFDESVGIAGSTHPDALTVAVLLNPELVTAIGHYGVAIETGSELTRGYSSMSWACTALKPTRK